MKYAIALALLIGAAIGFYTQAKAGTCTTTCQRIGNYTYCTQNCY